MYSSTMLLHFSEMIDGVGEGSLSTFFLREGMSDCLKVVRNNELEVNVEKSSGMPEQLNFKTR